MICATVPCRKFVLVALAAACAGGCERLAGNVGAVAQTPDGRTLLLQIDRSPSVWAYGSFGLIPCGNGPYAASASGATIVIGDAEEPGAIEFIDTRSPKAPRPRAILPEALRKERWPRLRCDDNTVLVKVRVHKATSNEDVFFSCSRATLAWSPATKEQWEAMPGLDYIEASHPYPLPIIPIQDFVSRSGLIIRTEIVAAFDPRPMHSRAIWPDGRQEMLFIESPGHVLNGRGPWPWP